MKIKTVILKSLIIEQIYMWVRPSEMNFLAKKNNQLKYECDISNSS